MGIKENTEEKTKVRTSNLLNIFGPVYPCPVLIIFWGIINLNYQSYVTLGGDTCLMKCFITYLAKIASSKL